MDVTTTRTCHICASYLPTRQEQVTPRAPASTSINETKQTLNEDLKTGELTAKQREAVGKFNDLAERGCRVTLLAELAAQRQAPDAAYGSEVESSALHINWLSNKFPLRLAPPPLH
ncbi:uncharacterized protein LOC108677149 [Hyalella azteca]|uniref:Uncharacterized protein LOC108677149 n=1 Tax=Hyalella azteca TaxID=294128 RepID=A0A8B7P489_HYAAZ|nr:uncharacterized protein LOC108677149 [Hyalella azteca]